MSVGVEHSPVANARMYSVTPAVKKAWQDVLHFVLATAGLPWRVIDHDAPAPLSALWSRDDLGLALMCGLPFSQRARQPLLLAAPVPSPARYQGQPIYFTDLAVRADSQFRTLEDTFGGVVGYTVAESLSGHIALRRHLLRHRPSSGTRLYREAVGGLIHGRGVIEALADGRIDVGPIDSYYHDLLRRSDPGFAAQVRVLATTDAAPIPPFVATAAMDSATLARLREALAAVGQTAELSAQRDVLLLKGFAVPDPLQYRQLTDRHRKAFSFEGW
jgi:ABC-type phosphate/phosphonate transport system substrate-binding protein